MKNNKFIQKNYVLQHKILSEGNFVNLNIFTKKIMFALLSVLILTCTLSCESSSDSNNPSTNHQAEIRVISKNDDVDWHAQFIVDIPNKYKKDEKYILFFYVSSNVPTTDNVSVDYESRDDVNQKYNSAIYKFFSTDTTRKLVIFEGTAAEDTTDYCRLQFNFGKLLISDAEYVFLFDNITLVKNTDPPDSNLVPNGDFEAGSDPWSAVAYRDDHTISLNIVSE
jgi:hypothetical protein